MKNRDEIELDELLDELVDELSHMDDVEYQYSICFVPDDVEGEKWWVLLENHLIGKLATEEEAKAAVRECKRGDDESWALISGERKFQS
jgi:hypothetical protein